MPPEGTQGPQRASPTPGNLRSLFRKAKVEAQSQAREARRRTELEGRRREEAQRREVLRSFFHETFEVAKQFAPDSGDPTRAEKLTEQIMALGQGIVAEGLGRLLDQLPTAGTPDLPHFLPLRFAILLLRAARDRHPTDVRAALESLCHHPNLRDYYRWLPMLADRFCGYAAAMPGVLGKVVEVPPLPAGYTSPENCREAERALGFTSNTYSPKEKRSGIADHSASHGDSRARGPARDARLNRREYDLLEALYRLRAFSCDSSQTAEAIVRKAEGPKANPENFKQSLSRSRHRGLVDSKIGRGGGYWLTPDGRDLIQRVRNLPDPGAPLPSRFAPFSAR
jgi:hypothetical protein